MSKYSPILIKINNKAKDGTLSKKVLAMMVIKYINHQKSIGSIKTKALFKREYEHQKFDIASIKKDIEHSSNSMKEQSIKVYRVIKDASPGDMFRKLKKYSPDILASVSIKVPNACRVLHKHVKDDSLVGSKKLYDAAHLVKKAVQHTAQESMKIISDRPKKASEYKLIAAMLISSPVVGTLVLRKAHKRNSNKKIRIKRLRRFMKMWKEKSK